MSSINQRLKHFIYLKGKSHREIANELEINEQQFSNWLNTTKPSLEGLAKIINHFPDLHCRWLMTGIGKPFWVDEIISRQRDLNDNVILDDYQKLLNELDETVSMLRKNFEKNKERLLHKPDEKEIENLII